MFSKFELTNKGVELLNRVIAEQKTLKFTKFQIGKGDFSGDKKTLTQLVSKIDEFNVSQTNVLADGITNIKGFYDNRNLSVASKLTEIGIMAQLGDDNLTEVLFSYSNQPNTEAETIPAKESYFSRTFSVMNKTDNVTSVTFDLTIRQDKYNFGTLAEMKAADYLDIGDKVTLWGNAALGDSSFKMYIITDQVQEIQLNNKLYAKEYFAIVNDLTTGGADKALSAEMGKYLEQTGIFGGKKEITASDDLDTLTQSGIYWCDNVTEEQFNYEGVDFYGFGTLIVSNVNKLSDTFMQMFISHNWEQTNPRNRRGCVLIRFVLNGRANNWYPILTSNSSEFLGGLGINYSDVFYIQDTGAKTRDYGYIDKTTGKLYLCKPVDDGVNTVNDITVTKNFALATSIENSKKVNSKFKLVKTLTDLNETFDLNSYEAINVKMYTGSYNNGGEWYFEKDMLKNRNEFSINIAVSSNGETEGTATLENGIIKFTNKGIASDGCIEIWAK